MLADLAAAVELGGQVVVLHGNGGHGKTTVAVQFARQAAVEVWWVDASSATNIIEGLREVALRAGADEQAVRNAWSGASSAPEVLWAALNVRTKPWLLVLDNADDPQLLAPNGERVATGRGWLRTPKSTGTVLITSRDGRRSEWGDRLFVTVGVLDPEDAATVLLDLAPGAGAESDARDLAERLGGLPLGLSLAGHYLRSTSTAVRLPGTVQPRTFGEYRQALADGAELGEHETLARTWELSLNLLANRGRPLARPLLRLLSTFAPAPIPVELLDASVLANSEVFAGITAQQLTVLVEDLRSLGLVDYQPNALVLHPLVRDANLRQAPSGYEDVRLEMLSEALKGLDPLAPSTWPLWRALLPHCEQLPDSAIDVHLGAMLFCHCMGLDVDAGRLYRRVLPGLIAMSGEDAQETSTNRFRLAMVARQRGEHEFAEAEFRAVLAVQQRTLGPDHPDTKLTSASLAAPDGGRQVSPEEAELRALLADRIRALGGHHPDTLEVRLSLSRLLREQGLYFEAWGEYREHLKILRNVPHDGYPHILPDWREIESRLVDVDDPADAEEALGELLSVLIGILGHQHPSVLAGRQVLDRMRGKS